MLTVLFSKEKVRARRSIFAVGGKEFVLHLYENIVYSVLQLALFLGLACKRVFIVARTELRRNS